MLIPDKSLIHVRPLDLSDKEHFSAAVEILNRTQGRNIFAPDYLDRLAQDSNALVVGAFYNKNIYGVGVAEIITDFHYYLPFDADIKNELANKKIGSFSTLAIHETFQGLGIGQKISQLRLEWIKNQGCTTILGVSWVSGLQHTSNRVFEKMGFSKVKLVENFYKVSSSQTPFDCPGCQNSPCQCSAILYRLDLPPPRIELGFQD